MSSFLILLILPSRYPYNSYYLSVEGIMCISCLPPDFSGEMFFVIFLKWSVFKDL